MPDSFLARAVALLSTAVLAMFAYSPAQAGSTPVHSPGQGSAERTAILDAIRPSMEREFREKIRFVVTSLRSDGRFAHVSFKLVRPNGRPVSMTVPGGRAQAYGSALLTRTGKV